MRRAPRTSLTRRMLLALVLPVAVLAAVLGLGGALAIDNIVEGVNDRLLGASARAIAETLALEHDELTLDLPASALGMMENESRDNVYYSVRAGGGLITGYPDLPIIRQLPDKDGETVYEYSKFREFPIRIVAMARRVPRAEPLVIVEVAETLDARMVLRRRMLIGLAILETALLGLLIVLLPVAVRWGLRPLAQMRRDLETRRSADLTPLSPDHAPSELRSLIAGFNILLARLESAVEGMRRFTADASHQMRTPLSILRTHVDVLRTRAAMNLADRQSIEDIDSATSRLQRLLIQLLALARAEGSREVSREMAESCDLVSLARDVAGEYAVQAVRADIDLRFEAPTRPVTVRTIAGVTGELVGNLIDNAIRYNHSGGHVVVAVEVTDNGGLIIVEDDGPGIPLKDRRHVFTRFHRLDRDQGRPGSGLGLAIVEELAETIGVTASLHDAANGRGLRVEIRFPESIAAR